MPQALSRDELENFLRDLRWENDWRSVADREAAYYDGNQLDSQILQQMKERGLAPLTRNLIGPTVDLVLGMEAKSKRDWKVTADQETDIPVAEALNVKLKEAERGSRADKATSDAYASQVKVGLGWVEVARESDPFKYPYRVKPVHRREIYFDWRAREDDLSDARFLDRRKWFDADQLQTYFPKHKELLGKITNRWTDWQTLATTSSMSLNLGRAYAEELVTTLEESEWRDTERHRLQLHEVWYRRWQQGHALRLQDGTVLAYDKKSQKHNMLLAAGLAQAIPAAFPMVRLSWWVGPHMLADIPSPYPHNRFPYVPFWGFREDATGIPYGLIRRMMSPQDEINSRLSKMMWLLSAKRIIADSDALDMPLEDVVAEAARPDAVILLNPNRKNKDQHAFRVESDFVLSQQQFDVMKDASGAIQEASGVYQAMLGKDSAAESGIAINSLVEQGSTTLAELNDNYLSARRLVGELLLSLVSEDLANGESKVKVETDGRRKTVRLNQPATDEYGYSFLSNSVANARTRIELEDVPDTPSYRMQQMQLLAEVTKSLPPEIQSLFADFFIRLSDLPFRDEAMKRVQEFLGLGGKDPEEMTPEELAAEQEAATKEQEANDLLLEEQRGKVEELFAKVEKLEAEAEKIRAETVATEQETVLAEDTHALELEERSLAVAQQSDAPSEREQFETETAMKDQAQAEKQDLERTRTAADFQMKQADQQHKQKLDTDKATQTGKLAEQKAKFQEKLASQKARQQPKPKAAAKK